MNFAALNDDLTVLQPSAEQSYESEINNSLNNLSILSGQSSIGLSPIIERAHRLKALQNACKKSKTFQPMMQRALKIKKMIASGVLDDGSVATLVEVEENLEEANLLNSSALFSIAEDGEEFEVKMKSAAPPKTKTGRRTELKSIRSIASSLSEGKRFNSKDVSTSLGSRRLKPTTAGKNLEPSFQPMGDTSVDDSIILESKLLRPPSCPKEDIEYSETDLLLPPSCKNMDTSDGANLTNSKLDQHEGSSAALETCTSDEHAALIKTDSANPDVLDFSSVGTGDLFEPGASNRTHVTPLRADSSDADGGSVFLSSTQGEF